MRKKVEKSPFRKKKKKTHLASRFASRTANTGEGDMTCFSPPFVKTQQKLILPCRPTNTLSGVEWGVSAIELGKNT